LIADTATHPGVGDSGNAGTKENGVEKSHD
jgi:hypothetical protein